MGTNLELYLLQLISYRGPTPIPPRSHMVPDYSIEVQETYADGPVVIIVGTASGTYSPDGNLEPSNRWSTPAALRAVVARRHVATWQVFADNEAMRQIMHRYGRETG